MLVWGSRTPYPAASLVAEWTGSLVHFPACPDMQQQWAWQKQSWKTGRESGSPKLFSVSGRKRKGSVEKVLAPLVQFRALVSHGGPFTSGSLYLFFSKGTKFLQMLPWSGQKKLSFALESTYIKTPSQNNGICLPQSLRLRAAAACGRWPSDHFPVQLQGWTHNTASQKSASYSSWGQWDAHSNKLHQWSQD